MRMCMCHWNELKRAIESRGLMPLVAVDGKTAMGNMVDDLNGVADPASYDPLMNANTMICTRALESGGLYLMTGSFCPLCEANKHLGSGTSVEWIKGCTDSILKFCQEKKLVPPTQ